MANPVRADGGSIRRGQASYQAHCLSCHGTTGRGDGPAGRALVPPPADLVAHAAHHSDGDYAWKIRTGNGPMPAFQEVLDESQVWDVVNYLRTLSSGTRSAGHHEH
jgi:mono/diheme cytochrome c family protein